MVLPRLRPTSGNFLGPKTTAATPAITTSSGTPSPNKALQVKPFVLLVPILALFNRSEVVLELEAKKDKFEEDEENGSLGITEEEEEEERERVIISMLVCYYSIFLLRRKKIDWETGSGCGWGGAAGRVFNGSPNIFVIACDTIVLTSRMFFNFFLFERTL